MDWQPGDLALCIRDGFESRMGIERAPNECAPSIAKVLMPRVGTKWRVTDVGQSVYDGETYLALAGQPSTLWFDAYLFTKLDEHEADAEDAETIRLLNGQPVPEDA